MREIGRGRGYGDLGYMTIPHVRYAARKRRSLAAHMQGKFGSRYSGITAGKGGLLMLMLLLQIGG
jgi:hypothetical protein